MNLPLPTCRFCNAPMVGVEGRLWDTRQWWCQADPRHFFSRNGTAPGTGVWLDDRDQVYAVTELPVWALPVIDLQRQGVFA